MSSECPFFTQIVRRTTDPSGETFFRGMTVCSNCPAGGRVVRGYGDSPEAAARNLVDEALSVRRRSTAGLPKPPKA